MGIVASNGKWVRISGAQNVEEERVFTKSGWVYAPALAVSIVEAAQAQSVWSSNSKKSSIVSTLAGGTEYLLEGCSTEWVKITIQGSAKPFSGWLAPDTYCGNPWNSCS